MCPVPSALAWLLSHFTLAVTQEIKSPYYPHLTNEETGTWVTNWPEVKGGSGRECWLVRGPNRCHVDWNRQTCDHTVDRLMFIQVWTDRHARLPGYHVVEAGSPLLPEPVVKLAGLWAIQVVTFSGNPNDSHKNSKQGLKTIGLNRTDNIVLRISFNIFLFCGTVSYGEKDWQHCRVVTV